MEQGKGNFLQRTKEEISMLENENSSKEEGFQKQQFWGKGNKEGRVKKEGEKKKSSKVGRKETRRNTDTLQLLDLYPSTFLPPSFVFISNPISWFERVEDCKKWRERERKERSKRTVLEQVGKKRRKTLAVTHRSHVTFMINDPFSINPHSFLLIFPHFYSISLQGMRMKKETHYKWARTVILREGKKERKSRKIIPIPLFDSLLKSLSSLSPHFYSNLNRLV